MKLERFEELYKLSEDNHVPRKVVTDDKAVLGLLIIRKYLLLAGISDADHGIIYSCGAEELVEAGITEEDTKELFKLGWMVSRMVLAKFV